MIVYNPRQWNGLVVLLSMQGSPLPQGAAFGLVSALIAAAVKFVVPGSLGLGEPTRESSLLDHPYSTSIFASLVSFLVAFRANLAYSRFWEGRTQLQRMSAMWGDVAMMVVAFDENAKDLQDYKSWKEDFVHMISLLHALAIMCLRCDRDLDNLVEHRTYASDKLGQQAWEADDSAGGIAAPPRPVLAKSLAKGVVMRE
jgi:predicted membrane chloride channel (bestrophin family)